MQAYLGTICVFGFNYAPYGWQYCNGQILAISQNAALFALLGTNYGGNGTSTFGLPNLQGRVSIHMGTSTSHTNYTIGEFGGASTATILISNLPAHTHTVGVALNAGSGANSQTPGSGYPGTSGTDKMYNSAATGKMTGFNISLATAGSSLPVDISDPSLVMNYCIAMQGIFPTRN